MRSPDDIKVTNGPPWWSIRNLITGAVIAAFLVLLGFLFYLRIRQWRLRAIVEERLRLAHELHDTLAQSFAGIGYQLRAILKNVPSSPSLLRGQVETASELVRQDHQEARRSISSLRNDAIDTQIELLPALEQSAKRMIAGGAIAFQVSSSGDPRHVPLKLADVLFRVAIEAIANTIRHANATTIRVHLVYGKNTLQLSIEDDGEGFKVGSINDDGFGLSGIQSRVQVIGGKVRIDSIPGDGTCLTISVPSPSSSFLSHLFASSRRIRQIRGSLVD